MSDPSASASAPLKGTEMETGLWFWLAFLAFTGALLAFDLGVLHRRDHVIRVREALLLSLFYIALGSGLN